MVRSNKSKKKSTRWLLEESSSESDPDENSDKMSHYLRALYSKPAQNSSQSQNVSYNRQSKWKI